MNAKTVNVMHMGTCVTAFKFMGVLFRPPVALLRHLQFLLATLQLTTNCGVDKPGYI